MDMDAILKLGGDVFAKNDNSLVVLKDCKFGIIHSEKGNEQITHSQPIKAGDVILILRNVYPKGALRPPE